MSNNIQNDLKIFLKISNNVIEDYKLDKKNYQTIQNVKNIFNNLNDATIFPKIDQFLKNTNSANRVGYVLDMYNKMYLETSNNFGMQEQNQIIFSNKIKNEEKKIGKSSTDKKTNNNISDSFMTLKYSPNLKKIKDNKMKVFGKKFVENNQDKCKLVINGKEYPLTEFYALKKMILKTMN